MSECNEKTYIGISLGPIRRILGYAKHTRAIWASSYLFAWLARQLVSPYYQAKCEFLKPYLSDDMFDEHDGVGRFPDQYVFEAKVKINVKSVCQRGDELLRDLADNMAAVLDRMAERECIADYLRQSLRIIAVEQRFADGVSAADVVASMQDTLAMLECRDAFCACETENYLFKYFESTSTESLLLKDAFGEKSGGRLFDTILECSVGTEYKGRKRDLLSGKAVKHLKPYQKYVAFVSADGDNFGTTLAKLGDQVGNVFKKYNRQIRKTVEAYGGQVIYQGGDDILFFAPVYNAEQGKDIFLLIRDIDEKFNAILDENPSIKNLKLKPSLSYGVSVSYYKFPMAETRFMAEQLLEKVKDVEPDQPKNKICWNVRKHSGQNFGGVFDKNRDKVFRKELKLITGSFAMDKNLLHSVTHWLMAQRVALGIVLSMKGEMRKACLKNFLANSFDEPVHEGFSAFFDALQDILLSYSQDSGVKNLHVLLRYIELLMKK